MSDITLEQIVHVLLTDVGEDRKKAENLLHQAFNNNLENTAQELFKLATNNSDAAVRQYCCILFRRKVLVYTAPLIDGVTQPDLPIWSRLTDQTKSGFAMGLFQAFQNEQDKKVMKQLAENISSVMLCQSLGDGNIGQYGELVTWCLQNCSGDSARAVQTIHLLFLIAEKFYELVVPSLEKALEVAVGGMAGNNDKDKRMKCLDLFSIIILRMEEDQASHQTMKPAVDTVVNFLGDTLQSSDIGTADKILGTMAEIAAHQPRFYVRHLKQIQKMMHIIAKQQNCDDDVRQKALELLVKICESCPALVSNDQDYIETILMLCFQLMVEMDDLKLNEWNEEALSVTVDQERNPDVGESTIDRLAAALGIKKVLPVIEKVTETLMQSDMWQKRHAALMTFTQIVEYLQWEDIAGLCPKILTFLQDGHPRVRWACINCVGQICTDHGPRFQKMHANTILNGFMQLMEDTQNPRVQAHAAAALINFTEPCESDVLKNHLEPLLIALAKLLQGGARNVQEQVITAVAGLAENSKENFKKYYSSFVPQLFQIINTATSTEYGDLRGRAFEALTFIGLAVGREMFLGDAKNLMEYSIPLMKQLKPDDPAYCFVIHSWARVADTLQQDFNPYVEHVIELLQPHVFGDCTVNAVQKGPHSELILDDGSGTAIYLDHNLVDLKKHSVHVFALIVNFCEQRHLDTLTKSLMHATNFAWDPQVNQCAVLALLAVLQSVKRNCGNNHPDSIRTFGECFNILHEQMKDTDDPESGIIVVNCLKALVRNDKELLCQYVQQTAGSMEIFISNLISAVELWGFHFESSEDRMANQNFDDYSKEFIREDLVCFDTMTKEISLLLGEVLALFGNNCAGIVNDLVKNKFDELWNKDQLLYKRTVVYFISDFVEHIAPQNLEGIFENLCVALFFCDRFGRSEYDASCLQCSWRHWLQRISVVSK